MVIGICNGLWNFGPCDAMALGRNFRITGDNLASAHIARFLARHELNTVGAILIAHRLVLILESGPHLRIGGGKRISSPLKYTKILMLFSSSSDFQKGLLS